MQLKEALIEAGIPDKVRAEAPRDKPLWHQVFRVTLTKFEIPILIKVECEREIQGLQAIAAHSLNSVDAGDKASTRTALEARLNDWFAEPIRGVGMLKYWKPYEGGSV